MSEFYAINLHRHERLKRCRGPRQDIPDRWGVVNGHRVRGIGTGSALPGEPGLMACWNGHRIGELRLGTIGRT